MSSLSQTSTELIACFVTVNSMTVRVQFLYLYDSLVTVWQSQSSTCISKSLVTV